MLLSAHMNNGYNGLIRRCAKVRLKSTAAVCAVIAAAAFATTAAAKVAAAPLLNSQAEAFLSARDAIRVGDAGRLARIAPQVKGYPLEPYLQYWQVSYRLEDRSPEEVRGWQGRGNWRHDAWQPQPHWEDHKARRWKAEHRNWTQRGGYGGYLIPDPQFSLHFGMPNAFRIGARPQVSQGYPRFWYEGFWIQIVDPWPEAWRDDWYQTDDVYIEYDMDGYYLFNRRHPGVGLALAISL